MSNTRTRAALNDRPDPYATQPARPPQQQQQRPAQQQRRGGYRNRSDQPLVGLTPYVPALNLDTPSGKVPGPFIVVEGGEKTGKSWALAEFTGSPRVGAAFWLDLSEGGADQYGAVPGARYKILRHDGTWREMMGQMRAAHLYAREAAERGDKPTVLCIDSGSRIWIGLSKWANQRARRTPSAQYALRENPDAAITTTMDHWNAAKDRWREMIELLATFNGVVVMTARGYDVAVVDDDGRPTGERGYKVQAERDLCFDATAHVRMHRDGHVSIEGVRSVHPGVGIRPGQDAPKELSRDQFTLDWFVFTVLRYNPADTEVRDFKELNGDVGEDHEPHEVQRRLNNARQPGTAGHVPGRDEAAPAPAAAVVDPSPFDTATGDTTGGEGDDEFARFCTAVVAATTRAAIEALWSEGTANGVMDRQIPYADGKTVRAVLTANAEAVKAGFRASQA